MKKINKSLRVTAVAAVFAVVGFATVNNLVENQNGSFSKLAINSTHVIPHIY